MQTPASAGHGRHGRRAARPGGHVPPGVDPAGSGAEDRSSAGIGGGSGAVEEAGGEQPARRATGHGAHATSVQHGDAGPSRLLAEGGQVGVVLTTHQGVAAVARVPHEGEPERRVPEAWDHPHLVRVVREGMGAQELLEYAPGGSLSALLAARGPLPTGEAVTLLVPLAAALAHLHAAGAVHGDMSPDNVLFRADGAPVLADPGPATALGEHRDGAGTEGFAAPEAEHTGAADVYGWGALAWFVLSGDVPGDARLRPPLPLLRDDVPVGVARLVEDCLEADPALRPPAAELGVELLALHPATPLDATPAAGQEGVPLLLTRRPPRQSAPQRWWGRALRRGTPAWGWSPGRAGSRKANGRGGAGRSGSRRAGDEARASRGGGAGRRNRNAGGVRVGGGRVGRVARVVVIVAAVALVIGGIGAAGITFWPHGDDTGTAGVRGAAASSSQPSAAQPAPGAESTGDAASTAATKAPASTVPASDGSGTAATQGADARGGQGTGAPRTQVTDPARGEAAASGTGDQAAGEKAAGDKETQARAALLALDAERTAALSSGDPERLASVYTGDTALAADRALLRSGAPVTSLSSRLQDVRVISASGRRVVLQALAVTVQDGRTTSHVRRFTLVETAQGWRVERVQAAH